MSDVAARGRRLVGALLVLSLPVLSGCAHSCGDEGRAELDEASQRLAKLESTSFDFFADFDCEDGGVNSAQFSYTGDREQQLRRVAEEFGCDAAADQSPCTVDGVPVLLTVTANDNASGGTIVMHLAADF